MGLRTQVRAEGSGELRVLVVGAVGDTLPRLRREPRLWHQCLLCWTQAHWAPCPQAKMSPRRHRQPGIPASTQRVPHAALRCQHPRTGQMPALPGALCSSQALTSLAARQAVEGEQESKLRPQPVVPRAASVGEAQHRQSLSSPHMGIGEDVSGTGPGEKP